MTVPTNFSQLWPGGDARPEIPRLADERATLVAYLDWQRATFELKCRGVVDQQLSERSVPPSSMSLHGLLRHLSGVERWWFQLQFARVDVPMLFYTDDDPAQRPCRPAAGTDRRHRRHVSRLAPIASQPSAMTVRLYPG